MTVCLSTHPAAARGPELLLVNSSAPAICSPGSTFWKPLEEMNDGNAQGPGRYARKPAERVCSDLHQLWGPRTSAGHTPGINRDRGAGLAFPGCHSEGFPLAESPSSAKECLNMLLKLPFVITVSNIQK